MDLNHWDYRYLDLASHVGSWSRDPSTKVGSVVVRNDKTIASLGFNGFPRGVEDADDRYADRDVKYPMVVHAEMNAILAAHEPLHGYTIYVSPLFPCSTCAGAIIQAGIKLVVATKSDRPGWQTSFEISKLMFEEAGVRFCEVSGKIPATGVSDRDRTAESSGSRI